MSKVIKIILNILISFVIIFVILSIIALNIVNKKILSKDYMLSKAEETEFYLQVLREIESGFENYIYQSGLPEDTIKDIVTEELVKKDVNGIIDYIYDGTEITFSTEEVQSNLDNKIQEYITSQNLTLNEQGQENVTEFEKLIVDEYKNNVEISQTFYELAHSGITKINNIVLQINYIPIIVLVVCIVLLIIINIKDLLQAINFLGISFLSTGILLKLGMNLVLANVDLDNLVIISTSLSNLVINIAKETIYGVLDNSNVFIICGIVAILVSAIFKNVNKDYENKPKRRGVKN